MVTFQCPNCATPLSVSAAAPHFAVAQGPKPALTAATANLKTWLLDPGFRLSFNVFVPSADLHEQYSDWAVRRGLGVFSKHAVSKAVMRLGALRVAGSGNVSLFQLPRLAGDAPPVSELTVWDAQSMVKHLPPFWWAESVEDHANAPFAPGGDGVRPPAMGWPWWRIPLRGEAVPCDCPLPPLQERACPLHWDERRSGGPGEPPLPAGVEPALFR